MFMEVAAGFFYAFVFLKQFYIFPSGAIGIGDVMLLLSGLLLAVGKLTRGDRQWLHKEDRFWYLFLLLVVVINGIYTVRTGNREFLKYTLYWGFCTGAIWVFRELMSERFLRYAGVMCRVNLLFQLTLLLTGRGRMWHETWGAARFMGTFNDPNQFAFSMFMMILFLYMEYTRDAGGFRDQTRTSVVGLRDIGWQRHAAFWSFFAVYMCLLLRSKSTGMMLGTAVFCFVLVCVALWQFCGSLQKRWLWWTLLAVVLILIGIAIYMIWPSADFRIDQSDYSMLARVQYKIWQFSKGNIADFLYDRKLERLVQYPKYLLYGAGEGVFERFPLGDFINKISPDVFDVERAIEIHCSLLSVCFCYGIAGMTLLLLWLFRNFRYLNCWQLAAVLALAAESFTLMNCRQPFFWFVFIFASAWTNRREKVDSYKETKSE